MKTILIPPITHLQDFYPENGPKKRHLLLSHLFKSQEYIEFYRHLSKNGHHIILDNSAHESGVGQNLSVLVAQAEKVCAHEIVLPDALFDSKATIANTEAALTKISNDYRLAQFPYSVMIVPQGKTITDYVYCFARLMHSVTTLTPSIQLTLGVSKDYEKFSNGLAGLLRYVIPFQQHHFFNIHMLGWGRKLTMLQSIASHYMGIRSIDSAKPFVYGISRIRLDREGLFREYPTRPNNYFDYKMDAGQLEISRYNCEVFEKLAEGKKAW